MANIFKVLSVLLAYPTKELQEAVQPIGEAIGREAGLPARIREQLGENRILSVKFTLG